VNHPSQDRLKRNQETRRRNKAKLEALAGTIRTFLSGSVMMPNGPTFMDPNMDPDAVDMAFRLLKIGERFVFVGRAQGTAESLVKLSPRCYRRESDPDGISAYRRRVGSIHSRVFRLEDDNR
jgi:hypothetical protein